MAMQYVTGSAASYDALVNAMEAAASAFGWTTTIADSGTGPGTGRRATFNWGLDFEVSVRSVTNLKGVVDLLKDDPDLDIDSDKVLITGPAALVHGVYSSGSEFSKPPFEAGAGKPIDAVGDIVVTSNYIGPQPYRERANAQEDTAQVWVDTVFPITYHIFIYDDRPAMIVYVQTGPVRYQWMMFGHVVKYGTWLGGGFYGASGSQRPNSAGNFGRDVGYSLTGASSVRSYAPWHWMATDFNANQQGSELTNTHMHIVTGTSESIDLYPWAYNAEVNPGNLGGNSALLRRAIANPYWVPLSQRSPNQFNEVSLGLPYWIATQREADICDIARAPHIRHITLANFNPGDVYENGTEQWMVFPYFEREGVTGLYGMAVRRTELS